MEVQEEGEEFHGPPAVVTMKADKSTSDDPMLSFIMDLAGDDKFKSEKEDKKPEARSDNKQVECEKSFNTMDQPVASVPSAASMPNAVTSGGSGTSVASSFTAVSSFSTPTRKNKKHSMKKFGSPDPEQTGYKVETPTRRSPTLEVTYFQIGLTVAIVCNLLNERGRENYAWKPFIVERVINGASEGGNKDWQEFTFTPTLTNVSLVEKRKEAHGPNEAVIGWNDYAERFLFFSIKSNPSFEDTRAKVTDFGNKLLEFFRFQAVPSYYIGEIDNTFTSKKLRDSLMSTDHELWKIFEQAKLRIVEEECLDSFFMDDKIEQLVPDELMARPFAEWPEGVVRKLYKSGNLPESWK